MKRILLNLSILILFSVPQFAQNQLQIDCGHIVGTCFSGFGPGGFDPNGHVMGIMDVRDKTGAPLGTNWVPPMQSLPDWDANRMGQVFGLAIDNSYNMYVTATTVYGAFPFGSAGGGGIYKVDATTGAVSDFITTGTGAGQLPNSGVGLGNIAYDATHDQFFVTNMEDGKIYRISSTGTVFAPFDPFGLDGGTPGFSPLGERIWGIAVYENRVYFSVWTEDQGHVSIPNQNRIFSIGLTAAGDFTGVETCEIIMPDYGTNFSNPVSDIAFSNDGKMLVGERAMHSDMNTAPHASRIFEFEATSPAIPTHCNVVWSAGQQFYIGVVNGGTNSAGGVDYNWADYDPATDELSGCDSLIWGSGDALNLGSPNNVYGFAGLPSSGNTPGAGPLGFLTTSYLIDADGNTLSQAKTLIGDVESFKCECVKPCTKDPDTKTFSAIIDSDKQQGQFNDLGYSGIQDRQSGDYLICGESYAYYSQDVFINQLDIAGNPGPSTIFHRGNRFEGARWMNETHVATPPLPAGGYFYTGSTGRSPERNLLFKATDKLGNLAYATMYDPENNGDDIGHSVIQNKKGGYVAVGERINNNGRTSVYAVGLDDNLNPTWVNEYFMDGFAWSVVEVSDLIESNIDIIYAVTGMHNDQVFVMFIDGSDGSLVPWLPLYGYDLDDNTFTKEVGHSINIDLNGDIIVTGSAEKLTPVQGRPENQLFIMRIPRSNIQQGSANGALDLMKFYDITDSRNEIARHIIADEENSYIVTGRARSRINSDAQQEQGEAFIMKVKGKEGDFQWINTYTDPNHIGSKGERVELTDDGGFYMTGSIWEENITGALNHSYNKFAVKTDQNGKLNDCDCCKPEEVEEKQSDWIRKVLQIDIKEEPLPEKIDLENEEVKINSSHCDQYCPSGPEPCDIFTTHTIISNPEDTCCIVSLDLTNNMNSVYFVNVEVITAGVTFDLASVNTGLPIQLKSPETNLNNIYVQSNPVGNPIPMGVLNDFITYCYEGVSSNQTIIVTYYDQFGHLIQDCRDVIETDCEVIPNDDRCVEVNVVRVECDSLYENKFKFYFTVTNYDPTTTIGTVTFTPAGPPVILLPPNIVITPPLVGVGTSALQCIDIVASGPFPTDIFLTYTMVDITNSQCCSNQDPIKLELPNCCSPCDEPGEQWINISQTTTNGDSCCHSLDIFNPCDYTLTKIQTEIVTPGVTFGSASVGGGYGGAWSVSGGSTIKDFTPNSIPAPAGNYNDLIEFCLDNPNNVIPQEVLVHYYISDGSGGDSILCTERLFFECVNPDECLELVHSKVFCDSETGKYYLDFWVENVSTSFTADRLEVSVAAPYNLQFNTSPSVITPIVLNPGDTYCDQVEIIGFPTPSAGDYLEIDFQMHQNDPYDCCYIKESVAVTLPDCCKPHGGDLQDKCCDNLDVDKNRITGGCCFETELTNFYSSNVQQVLASIITPSRQFTGVTPVGLYNAGPPTGTNINVTHPGQIPFGTSIAFDFCIQNTGISIPWFGYSTLVEYRWIETINGQSQIICRDTVRYRCGGIIDIPIDLSTCIDDVIKVSDFGDECMNVTTLADQGNESKSGVILEIHNTDVDLKEVIANGPANWDQPVVEDGLIYINFNGRGPSNDRESSIVDLCFSSIPADGIDIDVHWLETDNAGNRTRCTVSRTVTDCESAGQVSQSIESGVYHFDDTLESDGVIKANQTVEFKAGKSIQLIGGFEIKGNSILQIKIEDCINVVKH